MYWEKGRERDGNVFQEEGVLAWGKDIDSESWGWHWGRRGEQVVGGEKKNRGGFTPELGQGTRGGQGSKVWEA